MKYVYEGAEEFEGMKIESDVPREEWEFGSEIKIIPIQPVCLEDPYAEILKDVEPMPVPKVVE